ncbi:MAG: hypothetical protein AVDCRST_MAG45-1819 [uncultured Solirubrobacterales bacterium]|uniref:Uncharacterized protein n=1 Tax=uncultured Solirubrobacterales bacterium TaxID=768556 RepID=A0A6J4SZI1_9ACTN|nr:MAG: hypothetical protein AVDCRST_MAG45-1819 [uncultured Solirubrobacterales bacterium]
MTPVAPIGIGTSIVLIAVGAILKYAITADEVLFLDIPVTGTILLVIGILGLVLAITYTIMVTSRSRRDVAYDDRREVVREREYEEPTRRRERY